MTTRIAHRVRKLEATYLRAEDRCCASGVFDGDGVAPLRDAVIVPQPDHPVLHACFCKWCGRSFGAELIERDGMIMAHEVGIAHAVV